MSPKGVGIVSAFVLDICLPNLFAERIAFASIIALPCFGAPNRAKLRRMEITDRCYRWIDKSEPARPPLRTNIELLLRPRFTFQRILGTILPVLGFRSRLIVVICIPRTEPSPNLYIAVGSIIGT